jgi:Rhodopirellula transposase DDE domain
MGYNLQANLKTLEEGADHPDRDRQFYYLNDCVRRYLTRAEPGHFGDTKKKELIGPYNWHQPSSASPNTSMIQGTVPASFCAPTISNRVL